MDFQTIIVAIILLLAALYVGKIFFRRTKSFNTKGDCGDACGCDTKTKQSASGRAKVKNYNL